MRKKHKPRKECKLEEPLSKIEMDMAILTSMMDCSLKNQNYVFKFDLKSLTWSIKFCSSKTLYLLGKTFHDDFLSLAQFNNHNLVVISAGIIEVHPACRNNLKTPITSEGFSSLNPLNNNCKHINLSKQQYSR